jgi:predicted ATPase
LRATLDWSYNLLDSGEQVVVEQLSVFSGGCSLEAARFVIGNAGLEPDEVLDLLSGLVDKSMLAVDADAAGAPRYSMLESVRIYGSSRLAEQDRLDQARRAHREYFLRFAEAAESGLQHAEYRAWHRRVAEDYDNLRSACEEALASDPATALRLASALWLFWGTADRHGEGSTWLEASLATASDAVPPGVWAAAYTVLSYLAGQQDDLKRAVQAGERAIALAVEAGDDWEQARANLTLSLVLGAAGETERAASLLAESRSAMEATGDDFWVASSDLIAAAGGIRAGQVDLVERMGRQVLALARRIGYEPFQCWAHLLLGTVAERRADLIGAISELDQALAVARRLELPHYVAFALGELGRLTIVAGDVERSEALQTEAVTMAQTSDSPWFVALAKTALAATLKRRGGVEQAESLLREVPGGPSSPTPAKPGRPSSSSSGAAPMPAVCSASACWPGIGAMCRRRSS